MLKIKVQKKWSISVKHALFNAVRKNYIDGAQSAQINGAGENMSIQGGHQIKRKSKQCFVFICVFVFSF